MGAAYSSAPPSACTSTPIVACSSKSAEEDVSFAPPMHAGAVASPIIDPWQMDAQRQQQSNNNTATASSPSPAPPITSGDMAAAAAAPPRSSKPPRMVFDFLCFGALFLCLLLPWIGLPLYRRYVQVEVDRRTLQGRRAKKFDALVPDVLADSDDDEGGSQAAAEYERQREERIERSIGRQQSLMATGKEGADDESLSHISRSRRVSRAPSHCCSHSSAGPTGPFFDWSWSSLVAAFHNAFPLLEVARRWARSEGTRCADMGRTLLAVVYSDKRYLMHPRFYGVASRLSVLVTALVAYLLLFDGVEVQLHSPLLYALRFHLCALGAFAAISSVHSRGLVAGYKSVLRAREDDLERTRMKFVLDEDEEGHRTECFRADNASASSSPAPEGTSSPSPSSPSAPAQPNQRPSPPRLKGTNALLIARAIDSLSKQHKGAQLERRLVYILCMCLVRACIGGWGALSSGSSLFSSALHASFHCVSGFAFFALAVTTEFELHDDLRRWAVFSAMHSASRAEALRLPFHVPLRCFPHSDNIVGWWQIRCYLKDLKGRFDFSRMQILLLAVGVQLVSVALAPLYISHVVVDRPVHLGSLVEQLIAGSPLAAVDTALCLWLLLDMVAVGVAVNAACGRHAAMLQEQELQASFALSSAPRRDRDTGGERALKDSIKQLKALKERLTLVRESEKLAVWGFRLDERITTYLRTALVSYALLFMQTIFFKKRVEKEALKPL